MQTLRGYFRGTESSSSVQLPVDPLPERVEKYGLHFLNHQQYEEDLRSNNQPYSADIVAIHGLNGDAYKTWTVDETETMWLYHFLPAELPGARIFSFGYPSDIGLTLATGKLEDFARSLLNDLDARRSSAEVSRPETLAAGANAVDWGLCHLGLEATDYLYLP